MDACVFGVVCVVLVSGGCGRTGRKKWRRTEDSLGPVSDAFHERVSGHQGQRGGTEKDTAVVKGVGVMRFEFVIRWEGRGAKYGNGAKSLPIQGALPRWRRGVKKD